MTLGHRVMLVLLVHKGRRVALVRRALLVHKDHKAHRVHRDRRETSVRRVRLVPRVHKVRLGRKVRKDLKVLRVRKVLVLRLVVQLVSCYRRLMGRTTIRRGLTRLRLGKFCRLCPPQKPTHTRTARASHSAASLD